METSLSIILLSLALVVLIYFILQYLWFKNTFYSGVVIDKDGHLKARLKLRVATSLVGRSIGFMVPEGDAVLFEFDKDKTHSFWMKNVKFPIYAFPLEGNKLGKPTYMETCASRCSTYPIKGKRIIEIKASIVEKHNIREGDYFFFDTSEYTS